MKEIEGKEKGRGGNKIDERRRKEKEGERWKGDRGENRTYEESRGEIDGKEREEMIDLDEDKAEEEN